MIIFLNEQEFLNFYLKCIFWIYNNLDGDSLTIHDEGKRKKRYHNLCGVEKPLPIKMKKKSRVKNIIFKTKGGNIGYGFGMYLTALGCV